MKILQLAPQFPFPESDGGKIGIASTFRQLAKSADVTLFCLSDKHDENLVKSAEEYGKVVLFNYSTKNTFKRIFKSLFQKEPLYLTKHYDTKIIKFLENLVEENNFDIIHADHTAMAPLAVHLKEKYGIPVGLRLHNVEHLIWERYESVLININPKKWYIKSQAEKLKIAEMELLKKVTVSFPITEEDAILARKLSHDANIVVAAPGINIDNWHRSDSPKKHTNLIHATTYDWVHNVDAIRWFINVIVPKLQDNNPEIRLQLLGKNPPKEFYGKRGVDVLGFVPSVIPYLSSAGVYVAPLFVGGGIRIKILEAMAMQLPVVASPVAAEGIKCSRENGLIIAESESQFIDEITYLINNPEIATELGKNAEKFVRNNYTWEKSIGIIYNYYKNIVNS